MRTALPALVLLGLWLAAEPARADYMDHFVVREDVGPHKAPSLGPAKLLVIPVEVDGSPPLDLAEVQRFFSSDAPDGLAEYYRTASLGRYRPEVTVGPVVHFTECPLPQDTFPGCKVARGDIAAFTAGMDLIREVVKREDAQGVDFSQLDVNGRKGAPDGYADGVMILANIPFGGIAFPFAYYNRDDNLAGGTGGPLIVDGVKIPHVAIAGYGEERVLVHEFGHLLGLTDLYDESGQYDGLHFSVMGAWLYDPKIPLPDAETRYRLRWANLIQISGPGRQHLLPVESSGQVIRLGTGSQYFLVENRGPGGKFDGEFTARGLVVYHVDRSVKLQGEEGRFQDRILDCVNCDPWHPYIRVVEADGHFELQQGGAPDYQQDLFRDGDALGPDEAGQAPSQAHQVQSTNHYDGTVSGLGLHDVTVNADGSIDVTFDSPAADPCADPLCASGDGCQPVSCVTDSPSPAPEAMGCGCSQSEAASFAWMAFAVAAVLLCRRARPTS